MHEYNRLCAALLARVTVCILVRLPGYVVHVENVWAKDLPIESSVFQFHLSVELDRQKVRDGLASGEQCHAAVAFLQHLHANGSSGPQQVHISLRKPAMVQQPDHLLEHNLNFLVDLYERPIAHEESAQGLDGWDFEGEVEGSDDGYPTERKSITTSFLSEAVSWQTKRACEITHVVPGERMKPFPDSHDLTPTLLPVLSDRPLEKLREIMFDLRLPHLLCYTRAYISQHNIPFDIPHRVVKTGPRAGKHTVDEGLELFDRSFWNLEILFAVERIDDASRRFGFGPLPSDEVVALGWLLPAHCVWVDRRPRGHGLAIRGQESQPRCASELSPQHCRRSSHKSTQAHSFFLRLGCYLFS
mmetsp:Transcript_10061/g.18302  ORF Transcript_10061/g.18302 Transcript_10061/m.18302 type:complete len:358 (+) Transcript_10061:872-1945(+)